MRKSNTIESPHPNTPKKLWRLYKKYKGSCYNVGQALGGVNAAHIWRLLKFGREPKREDLRIKLFLKVKRKRQKVELPDFIKQWNKLPKEERHKVVQQYLKWKRRET